MEHRIIHLNAEESSAASLRDVLDERLRSALVDGVAGIGLCLPPSLGMNSGVLDWLESWQSVCTQKKRVLVVVAGTSDQLQHLELSHPDQNLQYVSSLDELLRRFPVFKQDRPTEPASVAVGPHSETPAPPIPIVAVAHPEPLTTINPSVVAVDPNTITAHPEPAPIKERPVHQDVPATVHHQPSAPVSAPGVRVIPGDVIRLSGEYACPGCGRTRMFAKGDRSLSCENPECRTPALGWELVFELF